MALQTEEPRAPREENVDHGDPAVEEGTTLEISLDEDEDEEPGETEPARASRKERRANRLREEREARERAEAQAEEARREAREARERSEHLAQRVAFIEGRQTAGAAGEGNPHEKRIAALRDKEAQIYADYNRVNANLTPAERADYQRRAREIQDQIAEAVADKRFDEREAERQRQMPHPSEGALQAEFPEIYQNPAVLRWAMFRQGQLLMERGLSHPTIETAREALGEAKKRMTGARTAEPPQRRDVDHRERQRFAGASRGGGSGSTAPTKVKLGTLQIKSAMAMYPTETREAACKKWVQRTGWGKKQQGT